MVALKKSLLMKSVWRIHNNPQSLLARVYNNKFRSPLSIGQSTRINNYTFSWGMRGLAKVDNVLLRGCNWKVRDGGSIVAGRDRWVNGRIPEFKSSVTLNEARSWNVNHFLLPSRGEWDHGRVNRCFEFNEAKQIVGMELPHIDVDDCMYWKYHKGGKLTVKMTSLCNGSRGRFNTIS